MKGVSKSFQDRSDSAAFFEAWVGATLSRAGLYTLHHPFVCDGGSYHGHSWDLDVFAAEPQTLRLTQSTDNPPNTPLGVGVRVEIKSLSLNFLNAEQYPYPDVLVCSQNSWLRKWPGANVTKRAFLMVSKPTGAIVYLPEGSPVEMGVEVTDKTRNEVYKAVKTSKKNLRSLQDFIEEVNGGL